MELDRTPAQAMNFPHGETAAQVLGLWMVATVASSSPFSVHTVKLSVPYVMMNFPVDAMPRDRTSVEES